jgi:hypothetical protein
MLGRFWEHQQSAGVFFYHCYSSYHHLDCEVQGFKPNWAYEQRAKPGLIYGGLLCNDGDIYVFIAKFNTK